MKTLTCICFLFLMLPNAKSQSNQEVDSLHHALRIAENDSVRMEVFISLSQFYEENNRDSSMIYAEQGLALSKKLKQPLWTADCLLRKVGLLLKQGNLSLSFKLINESLAISKDAKNEKNIYVPKNSRADWDPHKFRLRKVSFGFHLLGITYSRAGKKEKAIECYKEVIRIADVIKFEQGAVNAYLNIGSIYFELNKLDSAFLYTMKSIKLSNSTGYKTYLGSMLNLLGNIYSTQNQPDSAEYYYRKSLIVSKEQANIASEIEANIALAQLYETIAQTDSMLYYANVSYKLATSLKAGTQIATAAELISNAYEMIGNADSAIVYLSISKVMADSLNKVRTEKLMEFQSVGFEEQMQLEKTKQESIAFRNKIRTIGLFTGLGMLSILAVVFYWNNRQNQKVNKILHEQKNQVESTLQELKSTQSQLIQSEKMASLGELTAGIAHEIQNPLNFVNNFSELNSELIIELKEEITKGNLSEAEMIVTDLSENEAKITYHGKRADAIVKGMLAHSRSGKGEKEFTDINSLTEEYLKLSYHGLQAKDRMFSSDFRTDFDPSIPLINVIPQDIGRVLLNIINNAFYAATSNPSPLIIISTKNLGNKIQISISDNGPGIPDEIKDKIFQPFFTTKPTGQGTGLGLSLSYDIVKAHGGELKVESIQGKATRFNIYLPKP